VRMLTAAAIMFFLSASIGSAMPLVAVDADSGLPGIQSTSEVSLGSTVVIDITVADIEAGAPLNGFEFDLVFDATVLSPLSVVDGGFLLDPVVVVQESLGVLVVEFAEVTLGPAGAFGDGVLARVTFDTIGLGISTLDLDSVILSAPFGVPISANVTDGSVNVVPEPSTAIYLALGLGVLARRRSTFAVTDSSEKPGARL
jgi:hypothetical protein